MADNKDEVAVEQRYAQRVLELRTEFETPPFPKQDLSVSGPMFFHSLDHVVVSLGDRLSPSTVAHLRAAKGDLDSLSSEDQELRMRRLVPFCDFMEQGDLLEAIEVWLDVADQMQLEIARRYARVFAEVPAAEMTLLREEVFERKGWFLDLPEPVERGVIRTLAQEFPERQTQVFQKRCDSVRKFLESNR